MGRGNQIYPVTCSKCGQAGTLEFWQEDSRWGVKWVGFRGADAMRTMPRRARATCLGCKGREIQIGEALVAT